MNTKILGGNPIQEKTITVIISIFNIYYMENYLQYYTDADSYQYVCIYLQKVATFSRSPVATGRELQPHDLIY